MYFQQAQRPNALVDNFIDSQGTINYMYIHVTAGIQTLSVKKEEKKPGWCVGVWGRAVFVFVGGEGRSEVTWVGDEDQGPDSAPTQTPVPDHPNWPSWLCHPELGLAQGTRLQNNAPILLPFF